MARAAARAPRGAAARPGRRGGLQGAWCAKGGLGGSRERAQYPGRAGFVRRIKHPTFGGRPRSPAAVRDTAHSAGSGPRQPAARPRRDAARRRGLLSVVGSGAGAARPRGRLGARPLTGGGRGPGRGRTRGARWRGQSRRRFQGGGAKGRGVSRACRQRLGRGQRAISECRRKHAEIKAGARVRSAVHARRRWA